MKRAESDRKCESEPDYEMSAEKEETESEKWRKSISKMGDCSISRFWAYYRLGLSIIWLNLFFFYYYY